MIIPSNDQIYALWDMYSLPSNKRTHCQKVHDVASVLTDALLKKGIEVNKPLVLSAALLHDLDENMEKEPGDRHPDAVVRVLKEKGMGEIADLVQKHPVHAILDGNISPKTIEEKVLYLADKMTKYDVVTVNKRFELWKTSHVTQEDQIMLEKAYPLVKQLEQEIFSKIDMRPEDIAHLLS